MVYAFLQECFTSLADLRNLDQKNLQEMATRISRKPSNQGPVLIGMLLLKKVESLIYWVKQRTTMGLPLDSILVTEQLLDNVLQKMGSAKQQKDAEDKIATKSDPGKLEIDNLKCVWWKKQLVNHLYNLRGTRGVRLIYVARTLLLKPLAPGHVYTNHDKELIWNATHFGPRFQVDNNNLYQILERCCIVTKGETWLNEASNTKDGYRALEALCRQFDGPNMTQKRKTWAEQQLRTFFYKSEKTSMRFDKFTSLIKDAFDIMEDCGIAYPVVHKIE
ncbi:hypothetical protein ACA910_009776 [Epithemia clementina (nom. ined.)]